MSVIVALKKNGRIYLGADSQVTKGGSRSSLSNPNNYKIWKVRGADFAIMGHVGVFRDACAIRVVNNFIREIDEIHNDVDFEYVVERIEPMIKDVLKEHEFIDKDNPYKSLESKFIFAYKDKLYTIEYGAVVEHDDFVAIGSGESEAIGSLLSTTEIKNPYERIVKAIKSSAVHDIYVDYPIIITDTKSTEFAVVTEKNEKEFLKLTESTKEEKGKD